MKPFKTIKKHWMGLCALLFWSVIPWFYISPPEFLFGSPVALFALGFLAAGLVFFCLWILKLLEGRSWVHLPRNRFFVISTATLLITVPYFLSPLAPSQCMYKSALVTVANAQGQNCTTTCTNWNPANCGAPSTCINNTISAFTELDIGLEAYNLLSWHAGVSISLGGVESSPTPAVEPEVTTEVSG